MPAIAIAYSVSQDPIDTEARPMTTLDPTQEWHKTVCILCSNNCGVEVRLDDREITRVRGNKAHVASKGYTCEKALRINHYQNARGRLTSPLRREADGSFTELNWDTAIAEVVAGFERVREANGGGKVGGRRMMYYGGGGQGNHLCGAYGAATRRALGIRLRSNALAQEKTGEAWVDGRMFGTHTHGDFHHAEVSVFVGKNPWQSHGFDETRRVLKAIAADENRSMIVIDPRRTETADLADFHLQVQPGTDAFCVAALGGVLVQEGLLDQVWLVENASGHQAVVAELGRVDISDFAARCGVDESVIRAAARRMANADSVAVLGPRNRDGSQLDTGLLPAETAVGPGRQLRQTRRHDHTLVDGAVVQLRDLGQRATNPDHRKPDHLGHGGLQRDPRAGPQRSPRPDPGHVHRERQSGSFAGRRPRLASRHGSPGVLGGNRRGDD